MRFDVPTIDMVQLIDHSHPQLRGCVAWFPMWEGSGQKIFDVVGRHIGSWVDGGSAAWEAAPSGIAAKLNNNGKFSTNLRPPTGGSPRSFTCWFKTTSTSTGSDNFIFGYGINSSGREFQLDIVNGVVTIRLNAGTATWGSGFNDGRWHHLTISFAGSGDQTKLRAVVDGKDYGFGSGTRTVNTGSGDLSIGSSRSSDTADNFDGSLADFRVYGWDIPPSMSRAIYCHSWGVLRRPWRYPSVTGSGGTTTGTAAQTLGSATQAASGTMTPGPVTGTAAQSTAATTQTASGIVHRIGTAAQTAPAATQAASGTMTSPVVTGSAAQATAATTQEATGVVHKIGTAAQTAGAATQSASGTVSAPGNVTGTAAQETGSVNQAAAGTHTAPVFTGSAAQSVAAATQVGTGSFWTNLAANVTQNMPAATQAASGTASEPTGQVVPGLEYTLPESRLHYTLPKSRLHYTLKE